MRESTVPNKLTSDPNDVTSVAVACSSGAQSPESDWSFCSGPWDTASKSNGRENIKEFVTLPLEIWNQIIAMAEPHVLVVLARVNTVAHGIAIRHLYTSISLPRAADSTKLLGTLCSPTCHNYVTLLRSLDIPINRSNCTAVNQVLQSIPSLSILKLKVTGRIQWPFHRTNLDLYQFHWEVIQEKGGTPSLEHDGGPSGLSHWLVSQPNIVKLKLVTHERISIAPSALTKLVRASGPMFIVASLVPGRPVDTVQVTPRTRDSTAGMRALGESTGPLKHLKIVSRPDLDHSKMLKVLSHSTPFLETISFEICGKIENLFDFFSKALKDFPSFPELQSLSFCSRVTGSLTTLDSNYYRLLAETIQRVCPNLRRIYFPGIMATLLKRKLPCTETTPKDPLDVVA
ncbi:hypothetical protein M408DRAFT_327516 [Serendipita vermifera MAFF 305830]|uniref:F-box domain-containing protein n=1 Tax=Serendipita vermifera MAFF 305830 TaxID=933852 RepID=A0A0C3B334_SERVB|nr:hypothetical protein M408DRAFT_327516 [Serendipita vermifera MAFF 305830]